MALTTNCTHAILQYNTDAAKQRCNRRKGKKKKRYAQTFLEEEELELYFYQQINLKKIDLDSTMEVGYAVQL